MPDIGRVCADCVNAYLGKGGVWCRVFHEDINNERVAEDCPEYEDWPAYPVEVVNR